MNLLFSKFFILCLEKFNLSLRGCLRFSYAHILLFYISKIYYAGYWFSSLFFPLIELQKPGGNHYTVATYGLQHFDGHQPHSSQEVRIFPFSSQPNPTITVSMSTPLMQSHLTSNGQNINGNTVNPQPFPVAPIMASPVSVVPPSRSIIGTTDLRYLDFYLFPWHMIKLSA